MNDDINVIEQLITKINARIGEYETDLRRKKLIYLIQDAMSKLIEIEHPEQYGVLIEEKSSESNVYVDESKGFVYKARDIFSHDALKPHNPWDCFYEQVAHNILFPNVYMQYIGLTHRNGVAAMLYRQPYIRDKREATDKEIADYCLQLGLKPENKFRFGNDYLYVTDVAGKNVLADDDDGKLFFIDTNIYFKKPAKVVLEYLRDEYERGGAMLSDTWEDSNALEKSIEEDMEVIRQIFQRKIDSNSK